MQKINIIFLSLLCVLLAGCASIAGSNTRNVNVNSNPNGAQIYIDNQQYGVTPATVTLPTYIYSGKMITLRKRGYRDTNVMVNSAFQPIALLDILLWPTFFVDALTGNLVKIDPASLNINASMERIRY